MLNKLTAGLFAAVLSLASAVPALAGPTVIFKTSQGDFTVELNDEKAPKTVANFLAYVDSGHYDGVIFHRVIKDFMAQGGGFEAKDGSYVQKQARAPIQNEADNGLLNQRGTLAMARTGDPHSASAQFFINLIDNDFLNHTEKTRKGWGYAVFGRVISGMDTVDKMVGVGTTQKVMSARTPSGALARGRFSDVPSTDIVILSAKRAE